MNFQDLRKIFNAEKNKRRNDAEILGVAFAPLRLLSLCVKFLKKRFKKKVYFYTVKELKLANEKLCHAQLPTPSLNIYKYTYSFLLLL